MTSGARTTSRPSTISSLPCPARKATTARADSLGAYAPYEPDVARLERAAAHLRLAVERDAAGVARLYAVRHGRPLDEVLPGVAKEIERQSTGEGLSRVFVALVRDEVVAYGRLRRVVPGVDGQPRELPEGWYLMGVIVDPNWRRRGIAQALGRRRLAWIAQHDAHAYCFSNRANLAALALHRSLGFKPLDVAFAHERAGLELGEGLLLHCDLTASPESA